MDKPHISALCSWPTVECWSTQYRCFVGRREQILMTATHVLGTRNLAELWFIQPALGLRLHIPCTLISTQSGYTDVSNLLMQIEFGVYT